MISVFGLKCVAKNIEGWSKDLERIWLNLPKNDRHFGYKQKFLRETLRFQSVKKWNLLKTKPW
jgi:hypothetical protein